MVDISDWGWFGSDEASEAQEGVPFGGVSESLLQPKRLKRGMGYYKNPLHFHTHLFGEDEESKIIHETKKAILYEVPKGRFWVPKALIRHRFGSIFVHRSFCRDYITPDEHKKLPQKVAVWKITPHWNDENDYTVIELSNDPDGRKALKQAQETLEMLWDNSVLYDNFNISVNISRGLEDPEDLPDEN